MQMRTENGLQTRAVSPWFMLFSGSTCASKPSFVLAKLDSHIPQVLLSAGATWSSHSSIVKCPAKTEAGQQRTKRRGDSHPPHFFAHTLRDTQQNQTHKKHSTGAMLVQKKKKGWEPKQLAEGMRRWMGRKFTVFMLSSQTVENTWNTICVFFLLAKLGKQQREQIPLQKNLPLLDFYAS